MSFRVTVVLLRKGKCKYYQGSLEASLTKYEKVSDWSKCLTLIHWRTPWTSPLTVSTGGGRRLWRPRGGRWRSWPGVRRWRRWRRPQSRSRTLSPSVCRCVSSSILFSALVKPLPSMWNIYIYLWLIGVIKLNWISYQHCCNNLRKFQFSPAHCGDERKQRNEVWPGGTMQGPGFYCRRIIREFLHYTVYCYHLWLVAILFGGV